jgi:hypothetical protein
MPEGENVAAFENEAANHASQDDNRAENLNHEWPSTHEVYELRSRTIPRAGFLYRRVRCHLYRPSSLSQEDDGCVGRVG